MAKKEQKIIYWFRTTKELERAMLAAFHSFTSLNHEVAKRNLLYFTPCNSLLFDNNIITAIQQHGGIQVSEEEAEQLKKTASIEDAVELMKEWSKIS